MDAGRGFCWLGKMKRPVCFLDAFAELYCYIWGAVGVDGYMYTAVMLRAGWMQRDNHVRGKWGYLCWRRAQTESGDWVAAAQGRASGVCGCMWCKP